MEPRCYGGFLLVGEAGAAVLLVACAV